MSRQRISSRVRILNLEFHQAQAGMSRQNATLLPEHSMLQRYKNGAADEFPGSIIRGSKQEVRIMVAQGQLLPELADDIRH